MYLFIILFYSKQLNLVDLNTWKFLSLYLAGQRATVALYALGNLEFWASTTNSNPTSLPWQQRGSECSGGVGALTMVFFWASMEAAGRTCLWHTRLLPNVESTCSPKQERRGTGFWPSQTWPEKSVIVLFSPFWWWKRGHHLSVRQNVNSKSERNFSDVARPGTDRTEADSGGSPLAVSVTRFGQPGAARPLPARVLFQDPVACLGGSRFWAPPGTQVPAPEGRPGCQPRGPAHRPPPWSGVEAARSRSSGGRGRGPFKEPRCGNPSPQSGRAGARQLDLRDGSPAPPSISRAGSGRRQPSGPAGGLGARNPAVRSRRVHATLSGTRSTGDAVCRARRRAGALCPAGPRPGLAWPGLWRPGSSRARGAEAAPAGACGGAAFSGPWAAQVGSWPAAPAHPDAFVRPTRASQLSGVPPGVSAETGGCFVHPGKPSWWSLVYSQVHQVGKSSPLLLLLLNKTRSFYSPWRCSGGSHF